MTDEEITRSIKAVRHAPRADRAGRRCLTMSDIARATGITRESLHNIASGKSNIGPKTRSALREYFGCEVALSATSETRSAPQSTPGPVLTIRLPDFPRSDR